MLLAFNRKICLIHGILEFVTKIPTKYVYVSMLNVMLYKFFHLLATLKISKKSI